MRVYGCSQGGCSLHDARSMRPIITSKTSFGPSGVVKVVRFTNLCVGSTLATGTVIDPSEICSNPDDMPAVLGDLALRRRVMGRGRARRATTPPPGDTDAPCVATEASHGLHPASASVRRRGVGHSLGFPIESVTSHASFHVSNAVSPQHSHTAMGIVPRCLVTWARVARHRTTWPECIVPGACGTHRFSVRTMPFVSEPTCERGGLDEGSL